MTLDAPWKSIVSFSLPVFAGLFLQQLYNTVGTIIVGQYLGEAAVAAVGTTSCLVMFFLAIANGFSAGAGIVSAQCFGAHDNAGLRLSASTSIISQGLLALVCTLLALFFCRPVLHDIMGLEGELLSLASTYFYIYALGLPFQFGYNIIAGILRGMGDSRATLFFLIISSFINIALNYLFVAIFELGVGGSAMATNIAQLISFIAAWIYMQKEYPIFRFTPRDIRYDRAMARRITMTGMPMALQQMIVSMGFILIQRAVNSYGAAMIASYAVAQRVECYLTMPAAAFQITLAIYTGQNFGANKLDRIQRGLKQSMLIVIVISLIISATLLFLETPIIRAFNIDGRAFTYCFEHLQVTSLGLLLLNLYFPVFGVYQGTKHAIVPTAVAFSVLTIRVLSTYILCAFPEISYHIIWYNQPLGFAVGVLITWSYYLSGRWKY